MMVFVVASSVADWLFGAVFLAVVVGAAAWLVFSERGQRLTDRRRAARATPTLRSTDGTPLACPKCGGGQFKVRRRTSTKVALGAASLLGQAKWVRCVTCGTEYRRG